MNNQNTKSLVIIALFAALISVSSYISIPLPFSPVPITLQTLVILLCGLLLSVKFAVASVSLWVLMGAVGLPVFANGKAGIGIVFGPTGGYIIGFIFAAGIIALLRGSNANPIRFAIAAVVGNFLVIYPFGVIGLMLIAKLPLGAAVANGVLPFIIGDIVKLVAAVSISMAMQKRAAHLLI